jgi:CubicO group peptidase (beta-lactamase class C family)
MAANKVPGVSIAVIDDFEIEWARAHGVVDASRDRPVTTATLFQASSISKAVTAVLALHLVEKGLLGLDERVNDRLTSWRIPDNAFTARSAVTLRQLLGHTACVNRPEGGFGWEGGYPSTAQVLDGKPPATNSPARIECVPGSQLRYSNFGYVIVQQLVEDVTRRPFAELAREVVFEPLGMASSSFEHPLPEGLTERAAVPHASDGTPRPRAYSPHAVAQGGLWTTSSDLARFLVEIMRSRAGRSNRILSQEMTVEMLTPQFRELSGGKYWGLGFVVLGDWGVMTAGADPGFRCLLVGFPGPGKGIVVMLNGEEGELLQLRVLLNFAAEYLIRPARVRVIAGVLALAVLLSALLSWPLVWLVGVVRRRKRAAVPSSSGEPMAARLARPLAALAAIMELGLAYPYVMYVFDPRSPLTWSGGSPLVRSLLGLSVLSALASLALVAVAVRSWTQRYWSLPRRIYFSLVTLATLVASSLWLVILGVF